MFIKKKDIFKLDKRKAISLITKLLNETISLLPMSLDVFDYAKFLMLRYDFQLFDSIIVSDAILNNCNILYTEDMCTNLLVEKKLKIINPFVK